MPEFGLAVSALALEAALGYPASLHRRLPHPVVWIGAGIDRLERRWNRPETGAAKRRLLGAATILLIGGTCAVAGWAIEDLCGRSVAGLLIVALIATTGLAQKSLYAHVAGVVRPLERRDLQTAREAVGRIVGRDVSTLDFSGIAAAALESLAESFNDGVVAPAFWLAAAGLPGLFVYKAVNTADSLIGHREERWHDFGWAAARTDDLMNLVPARLAGALIAMAGLGGWRILFRDARKHASPNAGWPEAAMAGALRVTLGGTATYDGVEAARPSLGHGPRPTPTDLVRGLGLYIRACALLWLILALGAIAWPR